MSESSLESRIRKLEDIEAIRDLKHRYCAHCDDNYNPDGIAALFTEDAIWEGGPLGRAEGREAIHAYFSVAPRAVPFAIHQVSNPIIEINGDTATGSWYLWQPMHYAPTGQAVWLAALYQDRYRRGEDGVWRIEHLHLTLRMLSPFDEGWVKTQIMELPSR